MPRNFVKNSFWIAIAFFCATHFSYAQADAMIRPPTTAQTSSDFNSDNNLALGGEYKSTKNVIAPAEQPAKWWSVTGEVGYLSEYIFRGTNLTPNSDGIEFQQVYVSAKGFTLGLWFGYQLGDAIQSNATALGEAGGGSSPFSFNDQFFSALDTAKQNRFNELDAFLSYSHSFGPIDVTIGNIAFLINRHQIDQFTVDIPDFNFHLVENFPSTNNEQFDRLYLALSTSIIHFGRVRITPTVTYYQTIYNQADDIENLNGLGPQALGLSQDEYYLQILGFKRNDQLGGYLEGKIQAVIPIIGDVLRLEPIVLTSYSFKDRSEGVAVPPGKAGKVSSSRPLTGFNHVQVGAELVLQITRWLSVSGLGNYANHLASPTAGTERNEWWGGGKVTVSF